MRLPIPTHVASEKAGNQKKKAQRYIDYLVKHKLGEETNYFRGDAGEVLARVVVDRVGRTYIHVNYVRAEDEYLMLLISEVSKKQLVLPL